MNVCARNTFVSLWLFFGAMSLSAQGASFYFPTINNAVPGTNRQVALKAVNLDSIVAMQMVIRWNPQVLEFINTNLYHRQLPKQSDGLKLQHGPCARQRLRPPAMGRSNLPASRYFHPRQQ
jgi:hypothetical protein